MDDSLTDHYFGFNNKETMKKVCSGSGLKDWGRAAHHLKLFKTIKQKHSV
jgi:hypothetical protein